MNEFLTFLKELAPIAAIIVFGWGVYQYHRSNELTFRRPYWEKLLALYIEATSTVSVLATCNKKEEWEKARAEFWRLYFGPLCLVENKDVESQMVKISKILNNASFESKDNYFDQLKQASLRLSVACRNSIRTDWQIPMEILEAQNKLTATVSQISISQEKLSDKN
jgi:hypothetical protein